MIDYSRFIEDHFDIIDKDDNRVPFRLWNIQNRLITALTLEERIEAIICKARQVHVSSLVLALFTVDFLLEENSRSVCIAHESKSTELLFDRVKFFIKSFEEKTGQKVPLQYNSRRELVNAANGARFYVGSAGSDDFGRSQTLTNVHLSEVAFYQNPEAIITAVTEAGRPKRVIYESTANGIGNLFHKTWLNALNHDLNNGVVPLFYAWWEHEDYVDSMPDNAVLTTREQELMTVLKLNHQQLAWRRKKIRKYFDYDPSLDDSPTFRQEHPSTWQEAFLSSGNPVFNASVLMWYENNKELVYPAPFRGSMIGFREPSFEDNLTGYLKVWKKPVSRGQYVIGADTSEGKPNGDYSCAQVYDRKTWDQVAVWHGRIEPDLFGRELYKLGIWYNEAMVAVERNNHGIATNLVLREVNYPNLWIREKPVQTEDKFMKEIGWYTDLRTKPLMISAQQEAIRDKQKLFHDKDTVTEHMSYHYDPNTGAANAVTGSHDDRVIADMIATQMLLKVPLADSNNNPIMGTVGREGGASNGIMEEQFDGEYF
jgi:hypothetical protein